MIYRITNTYGYTLGWEDAYDTQEEAAEALRSLMGWDTIVLSDSYAIDARRNAVSAYETQHACDQDAGGAYAPRIIEEGQA